jgi:hypothetical protein
MSFGIPVRNGLGVGLLASTTLSTRNRAPFSPASLFATGEQGAWYDPSDLTTLFQDSAGTTPVTTAGQPVGLMLDKSQGLVLGPQLIGAWASAGYWSIYNAGVVFDGSTAVFDAVNDRCAAPTVFTSGKSYRVVITCSSTGGGGIRFDDDGTGGGVGTNTTYLDNISTTATFVIRATASNRFRLIQTSATGSVTVTGFTAQELAGNHAFQSTSAQRPTYNVDGSGLSFLLFDGTDDGMLTNTITPGIDKAQVFAGVRKLSDAASGLITETSVSIASNNGAIRFSAPKGASANYAFDTKGTVEAGAFTSNTFAAPITNVVTGIGDIAGDVATIRVNGTVAASTTTDQGTGNYLAYPLYIGRRGGSSLPLNGRIYSLILRFGANLSASTILQTETWVGGKTGVVI